MKNLFIILITMSFLGGLISCTPSDSNPAQPPTAQQEEEEIFPENSLRVSVMAYNLENLFDTVKDPQSDFTFLPLSEKQNDPEVQAYCDRQNGFYKKLCYELDWSEQALDAKLERIKDTIQHALPTKGGPDIVMVEEVENLNVLRLLQKKLSGSGYKNAVLLDGDDQRGIDVGLLTRFDLAGFPVLHRLKFENRHGSENFKQLLTRGILEVPILLPTGQRLYAFALHFPSQANDHQYRSQAVEQLNEIMKSKGPNALVVAGGDFNIIKKDSNKKPALFEEVLGSNWFITHLDACRNCEGSHYYKQRRGNDWNGTWDFLDALLFPKSWGGKESKIRVSRKSVRVVNTGKYQSEWDSDVKAQVPARFEYPGNNGVSDHFPIYAEFYLPFESKH
jgi:hypothetical protein